MDNTDPKVDEFIDDSSIRMLDDLLWYHGKVPDTDKLSDTMWASRIMSLFYFKREEEKKAKAK